MLNLSHDKDAFVRRQPRTEEKIVILSDHRQDGNDEVHHLYARYCLCRATAGTSVVTQVAAGRTKNGAVTARAKLGHLSVPADELLVRVAFLRDTPVLSRCLLSPIKGLKAKPTIINSPTG